MDRDIVVQELLQLIEAEGHAKDVIRRSGPDGALDKLLRAILSVGVVALCEADASAAYEAGEKAISKVLLRIARDADVVHRRHGRGRA